ncbi:MAG: peptidoglycan DD-metalloendopeptidase family protein [Microbacteriaceae bacterium]|nr:peptidoglycan DD-metalloendopeptidase family protein [Microbacteriaceae bacterium]
MTRRLLGGAAVLMLALATLTGVQAANAPSAQANIADLPTWDDVQRAKNNQAATATKIAEIEALIVTVEAEVAETQRLADEAAAKLFEAEDQLFRAEERVTKLEEQAVASEAEAEQAAEQAATLVSQLYRSGGVDRNLDLFLRADDTTADELLDRLARMEKATERNTAISASAEQAMNSAKSLGDQAESARSERDKLRDEAEANRIEAAAAADAAMTRLAEQENLKVELNARLDALKDTTAKTVAGYEERVKLEREAQLKREQEERERREREAAEAAKNNGGGGGGGGGGSAPPSSGNWVRPLACCYWVSTEWWGYYGHRALDLAIGNWNPIYAASSGTVTASGWIGTYGYAVFIDHGGGQSTRYAHMIQAPNVRAGNWVSAGQVIGYVGSTGNSTGPHLHFETLQNGVQQPPRTFMGARGIYF